MVSFEKRFIVDDLSNLIQNLMLTRCSLKHITKPQKATKIVYLQLVKMNLHLTNLQQ